MCAALLWMMYGFFPARWALLGGVISVLHWGILSYWVNSYWGGTVPALGGALLLGAYARLRRRSTATQGFMFGLALIVLAYTRPLEGLLLAIPVGSALLWAYRTSARRRSILRMAVPLVLVVALGLGALGCYFKAITGSPFLMPYRVNQEMYGWPLTLPWQQAKPATYRLNELQLYFEWERCVQYEKSFAGDGLKFAAYHMQPIWRFFLGPALTIPFLLTRRWWRDERIRLALAALAISLVAALVLAAYPHYIAPATGCFLAVIVQAFRHLRVRSRRTSRFGVVWSRIAIAICVVMLPVRAFVDSTRLPGTVPGQHAYSALGPEGGVWRAAILRRLESTPGQHIVFVQYERIGYQMNEWVYNDADIDHAKVIWANDMGPEKNQEVLDYYTHRHAWVVEADDTPGTLSPYSPALAYVTPVRPISKEICPAYPLRHFPASRP